jgi:hypothetical protein
VLFEKHFISIRGRYICWWTINPRVYHPFSNQCFNIRIIYKIYLLLQLRSLNNVITCIIKAMINLPDNISQFDSSIEVLWFLLLRKTFTIFWFPIVWLWAYLVTYLGDSYSRRAPCAINYISTFLLFFGN